MSLHVCIIPSWYVTPEMPVSGVFFREQALALYASGMRVGVVAPCFRSVRDWRRTLFEGPNGVRIEDDTGMLVYRDYRSNVLPGVRETNARLWVHSGLRLFERYMREQGRPDIVHAHAALVAAACAARIKLRYGVPFVVTEHSTVYGRDALRAWQLRWAQEALRHADAKLVVSPQLGDLMEAALGDSALPWTWVPNMVHSRFLEGPLRQRRPDRGLRMLSVGSLTARKGHLDLVEAFARAFEGDSSVTLRIGGTGPLRSSIERRARELGVASRVTLLGELSRGDVHAELLASDVFVLPSHVETFGVVVVEALACGVPVVATASGGPEAIVTERDGLLVKPGDVDGLAHALSAMRENINEYDPLDLRSRCAQRFGERAVVDAVRFVYEKVLATAGRDIA